MYVSDQAKKPLESWLQTNDGTKKASAGKHHPLLLSHPDGGGDLQAVGSVAAQTAAGTKPLKLNIPNTLRTSPCLPGSFYRRTYAHS